MRIDFEIHLMIDMGEKLYCPCTPVETCPICLGHPGTKPILNHNLVGRLLNPLNSYLGGIRDNYRIIRKHYTYRDVPKNYQLLSTPIIENIEIIGISIKSIHFEEDAAKYTHNLVQFEKAGTPLLEVVTENYFNNVSDAVEGVRNLFEEFQYLYPGYKVLFKADCNISKFVNKRIEIKNLNSLEEIRDSLTFESERLNKILRKGYITGDETRTYDAERGITIYRRKKETSEQYKMLYEPELPGNYRVSYTPMDILSPRNFADRVPEINRDSAIELVRTSINLARIYLQCRKLVDSNRAIEIYQKLSGTVRNYYHKSKLTDEQIVRILLDNIGIEEIKNHLLGIEIGEVTIIDRSELAKSFSMFIGSDISETPMAVISKNVKLYLRGHRVIGLDSGEVAREIIRIAKEPVPLTK